MIILRSMIMIIIIIIVIILIYPSPPRRGRARHAPCEVPEPPVSRRGRDEGLAQSRRLYREKSCYLFIHNILLSAPGFAPPGFERLRHATSHTRCSEFYKRVHGAASPGGALRREPAEGRLKSFLIIIVIIIIYIIILLL